MADITNFLMAEGAQKINEQRDNIKMLKALVLRHRDSHTFEYSSAYCTCNLYVEAMELIKHV
jgi:hypothetical protein